MIGITVTFRFLNFFNSLERARYFFEPFSKLLFLLLGLQKRCNLLDDVHLLWLSNTRSRLLANKNDIYSAKWAFVSLVNEIIHLCSAKHKHKHHHHHHHVVPLAWISLTLSRHFSLSFIASGRSSRLHPVSSHNCWMYVRAIRPAFARPYVEVHRSTSLMTLFLLLQQCPACLVRLTWIGWWWWWWWWWWWFIVQNEYLFHQSTKLFIYVHLNTSINIWFT